MFPGATRKTLLIQRNRHVAKESDEEVLRLSPDVADVCQGASLSIVNNVR